MLGVVVLTNREKENLVEEKTMTDKELNLCRKPVDEKDRRRLTLQCKLAQGQLLPRARYGEFAEEAWVPDYYKK